MKKLLKCKGWNAHDITATYLINLFLSDKTGLQQYLCLIQHWNSTIQSKHDGTECNTMKPKFSIVTGLPGAWKNTGYPDKKQFSEKITMSITDSKNHVSTLFWLHSV